MRFTISVAMCFELRLEGDKGDFCHLHFVEQSAYNFVSSIKENFEMAKIDELVKDFLAQKKIAVGVADCRVVVAEEQNLLSALMFSYLFYYYPMDYS